jgi:hypothetical protein
MDIFKAHLESRLGWSEMLTLAPISLDSVSLIHIYLARKLAIGWLHLDLEGVVTKPVVDLAFKGNTRQGEERIPYRIRH